MPKTHKTLPWRKLLFILKRRGDYDPQLHDAKSMSTGLYNSATYIVDMLKDRGHDVIIEVAVDNNDIDRLVATHRPSHVIIEALWVVPTKFKILTQLHPAVTWIVRLHSDMPFLAGEGMAMDWIGDYIGYPQVMIAPNSLRMTTELRQYLELCRPGSSDRVIYLPNYYPLDNRYKACRADRYWIDVSCFGAVRPMKNHLAQAVAALEFARIVNKQLRFHINSGRIEGNAQGVWRNLTALFGQINASGHQLIAHDWMPRDGFVELCGQMDIAMQVSFSETFNIVAADHVNQGVPLVSSAEISWTNSWWQANPTDTHSMVTALRRAYDHPCANVWINRRGLAKYVGNSAKSWLRYARGTT